MNILYSGDENIIDGLIFSLLSLTKHIKEKLNVFILTFDFEYKGKACRPLCESTAKGLEEILTGVNKDSSVTLIDISDEFAKMIPVANLETRFTPGCMARLFVDIYDEVPDRILYLDYDVICREDFTDFYNSDLEGTELVGVLDHYGKWFFKKNIFKFDYINSGVLLLNLSEIRKTGLFRKCRERCRDTEMFLPDQSAINKLCDTKRFAPRRFNEQRRLKPDTVFHHFTTHFRFFPYFHSVGVKPWRIDDMHSILKMYEYDDLYSEYLCEKERILNYGE